MDNQVFMQVEPGAPRIMGGSGYFVHTSGNTNWHDEPQTVQPNEKAKEAMRVYKEVQAFQAERLAKENALAEAAELRLVNEDLKRKARSAEALTSKERMRIYDAGIAAGRIMQKDDAWQDGLLTAQASHDLLSDLISARARAVTAEKELASQKELVQKQGELIVEQEQQMKALAATVADLSISLKQAKAGQALYDGLLALEKTTTATRGKGDKIARAIGNMNFAGTHMGLPLHDRHA